MGNQNKIAYLDTDFINKTIKTNEGSSTLFDEIIKLPYKFIIVYKVYNEIKDKIVLGIINKYIQQKRILLVRDFEIVKNMKSIFDDKTIQQIILSEIYNISFSIFENDDFYNNYFKKLEALYSKNTRLKLFIVELDEIIKSIPKGNNIGEIVTILNISIANRIGGVDIFALLSHDSSARRYILKMPENVYSYDCYSSFCLLKNFISEEIARGYAKAWRKEHSKNCTVTINKEGRSQGVDILEFIKDIYSKDNYKVFRNGLVVFK